MTADIYHIGQDECVCLKGKTLDNIYVIAEGSVSIDKDNSPTVLTAPQAFGTGALFGRKDYHASVFSRGATLFVIPKKAALDTAEFRPKFAIDLMAVKLATGHQGLNRISDPPFCQGVPLRPLQR